MLRRESAQGSQAGRKAMIAVAAAGTLALMGCSTGASVADKVISGGRGPIEVSPDAFATPVYCPPLQLQANSYLIMKYQRGREDQPEGLLYQATLSDWARSCTREGNGQTRIKLGLSGSVTPGPAWKGGEVVLPLEVAVRDNNPDDKPLIDRKISVPVTLGEGAPAENWTLVEDSFVVPRDQQMKVVFGFEADRRRR
ncbi:hypothetical protein [Roseibium sp. RKSG952]|uniref:hypothetical protein n=1 Tax=Roseibium sp. RKSG952 TaxID=2529384 RepID=UPI001AD93516|nr:hypothetical protein [Roseibium sp. RKSG952]